MEHQAQASTCTSSTTRAVEASKTPNSQRTGASPWTDTLKNSNPTDQPTNRPQQNFSAPTAHTSLSTENPHTTRNLQILHTTTPPPTTSQIDALSLTQTKHTNWNAVPRTLSPTQERFNGSVAASKNRNHSECNKPNKPRIPGTRAEGSRRDP